VLIRAHLCCLSADSNGRAHWRGAAGHDLYNRSCDTHAGAVTSKTEKASQQRKNGGLVGTKKRMPQSRLAATQQAPPTEVGLGHLSAKPRARVNTVRSPPTIWETALEQRIIACNQAKQNIDLDAQQWVKVCSAQSTADRAGSRHSSITRDEQRRGNGSKHPRVSRRRGWRGRRPWRARDRWR